MRSLIGSILLVLLPAADAAPRLVADVNKNPDSVGTYPMDLTVAGDRVYFTADDRTRGRELWVSDGTSDGTRLVTDLRVGQAGSAPSRLQPVGDRIFFFADDGEHGLELWSSDRSDVVMAGDNGFGESWSRPTEVVAAGGLLYVTLGPHGNQPGGWGLWRSDGTAEGTRVLNPPAWPLARPFGSSSLLTEMNDMLFFANIGRELWRSAGTTEQTVRLADVGLGAEIVSMAGSPGQLWLTVDRGQDKELWSSDGATAEMVSVLAGGALESDQLVVASGRAFFAAGGSVAGAELWTSDGATTTRISDINEGPASSGPQELTSIDDVLYFTASNGVGRGIWCTDGHDVWCVMPGRSRVEPEALTALGGDLFFLMKEGGHELWRSDGTTPGTVPVRSVTTAQTAWSSPGLVASGQRLFLRGNDGSAGFELWSSDGTTEGTGPLHDPNTTMDGQLWIEPGGVAGWGDGVAFIGDDGTSGEEPWFSDGTEEGTRILADVRPGPDDASVSRFLGAGEDLYFTANDGVHGLEPWHARGDAVNLVADVRAGAGFSYPGGLTVFGDRMVFSASDDTGKALWLTGGSGVEKLHPKAGGFSVELNGHILFAGSDAAGGEELWRTDGVVSSRVSDLRPGTLGSSPAWLTRVGGSVYFQANTGAGFSLWRTDGTESGTSQVNGWNGPTPVYPLTAVRSRLFFFEDEYGSGERLWMVADGVAHFLKALDGSDTVSYPADGLVQSCSDLLYFVGDDGRHGPELWRSDGTPDGTVMVRDVRPGPVGSAPSALTAVGGNLYFQANDGSEEGTRLVHDLVAGSGGSAPGQLVLAGRRLFFSAQTPETGREPHLLEVGPDLDYHAWAQASGLSGVEAALGSSPWSDGVPNLIKYAFGIAGGSPYQRGMLGELGELPRIEVQSADNGHVLRIEFMRRIGGGLVYTAKRSTTLEAGSFHPMGGTESVDEVNPEWEQVVVEERVTTERYFATVEVRLR